jgi:hypothetical protein
MNPELIEKHRDINVDHDWWDCTYDHFMEDMKQVGITVKDMRFSGFWSQGDGASFTGYIHNNKLFFERHKLTDSYPMVVKLLDMGGGFTLSIDRTGYHYVHENTVSVDLSYADMFYNTAPRDDGGLRDAVIAQWDMLLDLEYTALTSAVQDIVRDYCRDLYRLLEAEYNHLTSDEAVWEAIVANDLDEVETEETV